MNEAASFFGSPNRSGTSSSINDAIVRKIESCSNLKIKKFYVHEMNIFPCDGCGFCKNSFCCKYDDLSEVYEAVEKSSILIFSFPIYFSSLPGKLKTLIDRFQPFWESSKINIKSSEKKTTILIMTAGSNYSGMYDPSLTVMRHFSNVVGYEIKKIIKCSDLDTSAGSDNYRKILEEISTSDFTTYI